MKIRPYQSAMIEGINNVWRKKGTPLAVLPTGGGKTFIFARIIKEHKGPCVAIAHRQEIVGQMSAAISREGLRHGIIAPNTVVRSILHHHGSLYSPTSPVAVAGVDSLRRMTETWRNRVTLVVIDEAHHVLRKNKWGRALALFPHAKILGVTATPERADGKGLGAHADGVFTDIVAGPTMRKLIDDGYLCDYRVCSPPLRVDSTELKISATTGDYTRPSVSAAMAKACITGDVVACYQRFARGRTGVTFAINVDAANQLADAYNAAGVPAAAISAKTPASERTELIRRLASRELLQLVNVDIFSEGFDLPAIEVVSMVRPTQSFPLFCQSFGRSLRPLKGKNCALIIDHVGNITDRHGLPDAPRIHTLDGADRKSSSLSSPLLKACPSCMGVFPRFKVTCPYCDFIPERIAASSPEHVDGDLYELDEETLTALRGGMARRDLPPEAYADVLRREGCPPAGVAANIKRQKNSQDEQHKLRVSMDWWRGMQQSRGLNERETHRLFFITFQTDVLSAQALPYKDALALRTKIRADLPFAAACMLPL